MNLHPVTPFSPSFVPFVLSSPAAVSAANRRANVPVTNDEAGPWRALGQLVRPPRKLNSNLSVLWIDNNL